MRGAGSPAVRVLARRAMVTMAGWLAMACGAALPASAQDQPVVGPASVIDGSSPDLISPLDLGASIARDGTGGAVYLKQAGAEAHVFVSRLAGGVFQPPVEIDAALAGPSSQPVIAAGDGGLLTVAFINNGQLFVSQQAATGSGFTGPSSLAASAVNPSMAMTTLGKAYVAFAVSDGSGEDIRTAYFYQGKWSLEPTPLNASPGDSAGIGSGRPSVAAAGDGVAVVGWGEAGGIYTRRVWGTSSSVLSERADGPLPGCTEVSADQPAVGTGGDSSYAAVVFHEQLSCAGQPSERVLMNRLRGSAYDGLQQPDGLGGGGDGADDPQVAVGEYGAGLLTSERTGSHALVGAQLGSNETGGPIAQVNSSAGTSAPLGVPAMVGFYSRIVAWQQDPGGGGVPEIRLRYAPGKEALGPEIVVSSPAQGPTDAAAGLAVSGDIFGDAAVLWVQGASGSQRIMAAQLYQPPGGFSIVPHPRYVSTARPSLGWTAPDEPWGPIRFTLSIDGQVALGTDATSAQPPVRLSDGLHHFQVTASNPAGQQSHTQIGSVFVDTVSPLAGLTLTGRRHTGQAVRARMSWRDEPPPGRPAGDASGVASVRLEWGDGTADRIGTHRHAITHVYTRPGRYAVMLVVADRAGNVTRSTVKLTIVKPPKPKPKPKGHGR